MDAKENQIEKHREKKFLRLFWCRIFPQEFSVRSFCMCFYWTIDGWNFRPLVQPSCSQFLLLTNQHSLLFERDPTIIIISHLSSTLCRDRSPPNDADFSRGTRCDRWAMPDILQKINGLFLLLQNFATSHSREQRKRDVRERFKREKEIFERDVR